MVDADACPRGAAATIRRLQAGYGYAVLTVASLRHKVEPWGPWHEHVVVGPEREATDIVVANRARRGDVVVTQDWGLAALTLARGCRAVSPLGYVYRPETLAFLLEERHLKARLRRAGGRTKGPPRRDTAVEARFERAFIAVLEEVRAERAVSGPDRPEGVRGDPPPTRV
ncbi:MAG: DUF188 domain-containing protein [Firmicutes bacterium]|nr:DUF188 domain-containing protein [Bacillota bacterium]